MKKVNWCKVYHHWEESEKTIPIEFEYQSLVSVHNIKFKVRKCKRCGFTQIKPEMYTNTNLKGCWKDVKTIPEKLNANKTFESQV